MKNIVFTLFVLVLLFGCNKNNKTMTTCSKKADNSFTLKITGKTELSFICDYWLINQDAKELNSLLAFENDDLYDFIRNNYKDKIELLSSSNIYSVVLYIDRNIEDNTTIKLDFIKGISIYEYTNKSVYHHLFLQINNKFVEQIETNVEVAGVSSNQIRYNLGNYVFKDIDNKTYLTLFTKDALSFDKKARNRKVNYQTERIESKTKEQPGGGGVTCGAECNSGNNTLICMANAGGWSCQANGGPLDPCTAMSVYGILDGYEEQELIDLQLMYIFRDNYLINTDIGLNYISYFDIISLFVEKELTFSIAMETVKAFYDFKFVINILLNPENHYNEILINDTLKVKLLNLIYTYRAISEDVEYQSVLNQISTDINAYSNQTVQSVINSIN